VHGGTLLTHRELYPSKDVLDGAIASGMERGMPETLEQLEACCRTWRRVLVTHDLVPAARSALGDLLNFYYRAA
jgi:hypothetical protein